MTDIEQLTAAITEIVRATPGVAEIYPARPVALATIDQLVKTALPEVPTAALVSVSETEARVRAEIRIAVTDELPAADICRNVYAAVAEHLTARGGTPPEIRVTVARIV